MTAKIGLQDVRFHAPHGFFEEEHRMGNEFSVDVEVEASIGGAAQQDDLGGTVNYATIYYLVQAEMKKPTLLLEALAYRIGNRIQQQFDSVSSVKVRLRKLNPPLGGKVGAAFVEVNLGAGGGGGSFGGATSGQPHTFEDRAGFPDDDYGGGGSPAGGGVGGGGFSFSGGGLSDFNKPAPGPAPVFDDLDDEDWDDDEDFTEEDLISPEEVADLEEFEDDFDEADYAEDDDGAAYGEDDFDDMDFGDLDLDDFDMDGFNFDDLDLDGKN